MLAIDETIFVSWSQLWGSPLGRLFNGGFVFSLFFHLAHGVRHLIWDTGLGFSKQRLALQAQLVWMFAAVMSLGWFLLVPQI
jgi:succinate dehydrogenase / fumarate reductase cytochrome b subunit